MSITPRAAATVLIGLTCSAVLAQNQGRDCLHSFSVEGSPAPVSACGYEDPRRIGEDFRVRETMTALGIRSGVVAFRGCAGQPFSAAPDTRDASPSGQYVVTYPSDLQSPMNAMVAPIVHELAHVAQMLNAQGLESLRKNYESRRIELGADFVSGLVFAKALKNQDIKDFLLNLNLIGSYRQREVETHGTPEQRSNAFRLGAFLKYPYNELSIPKSEQYFQENDYARALAL